MLNTETNTVIQKRLPMTVKNIFGIIMYKINSQGGIYVPGKPTPFHVRSFIIDLFTTGQTYSEIAAAVRVDIETVN